MLLLNASSDATRPTHLSIAGKAMTKTRAFLLESFKKWWGDGSVAQQKSAEKLAWLAWIQGSGAAHPQASPFGDADQVEGPSLEDVAELCEEFGFVPGNNGALLSAAAALRTIYNLRRQHGATNYPAAQPAPAVVAPEDGETEELVQWLEMLRDQSREAVVSYSDKVARIARIVELLRQQTVTAALPAAERLRIVKRGIVAGYNLGHHHTVEGCWGDPDEAADDYAKEALQDLGDEPAPAVVPVAYDAGDGISIHRASQAPEAWAVRRDMDCLALDGTWSYEPMPSSRTEEWLARHRFTSAEAAASAIPLPQAEEVEA